MKKYKIERRINCSRIGKYKMVKWFDSIVAANKHFNSCKGADIHFIDECMNITIKSK